MAIQLRAVGKSVAAELAGEGLLVLLVSVLDVLLEGGQPLVAAVAVGAGQQLGKVIWRPECQVCTEIQGRREQQNVRNAGQEVLLLVILKKKIFNMSFCQIFPFTLLK